MRSSPPEKRRCPEGAKLTVLTRTLRQRFQPSGNVPQRNWHAQGKPENQQEDRRQPGNEVATREQDQHSSCEYEDQATHRHVGEQLARALLQRRARERQARLVRRRLERGHGCRCERRPDARNQSLDDRRRRHRDTGDREAKIEIVDRARHEAQQLLTQHHAKDDPEE